MVKAGVFLVARIGPIVFALAAAGILADQFFEIVAWVGAITALLLATQGMVNPEIKKVLAYSTGSQIGYMMKAFIPACVGEKYSITPSALRPSCPTWCFFLSRYQKLIKA